MADSVNSQITNLATVQHLGESARAKLAEVGGGNGQGQGHAGHASVREVSYKGHQIRIETSYEISVDDQPISGHVIVGNNGRVHYHSIPNQEFRSAVDMVKRIIDLAPTASSVSDGEANDGGHGHGGGGSHHGGEEG